MKRMRFINFAIVIALSSFFFACGAKDDTANQDVESVEENTVSEIMEQDDSQNEANEITPETTDDTEIEAIDRDSLKKNMASLYEKAKSTASAADFTGDWTSDIGDITISNQDENGFQVSGTFLYEVIGEDPPFARTGTLEGEALFINDNVAICKLEDDYVRPGEEAYVGFILNGDSLEVVESEGFFCTYFGMGVTSEGTYKKY